LLIAPQQDTHIKVNLKTPNKAHSKDTDEFSANVSLLGNFFYKWFVLGHVCCYSK
jgi:hypothetical protein